MASVTSVTSVQSNGSVPHAHASPPPALRKQDSQSTPQIATSEPNKGVQLSIPSMPRQPSYKNLADSPSPRSKLGDRVKRLKQRCINSLGEELFNQAYDYLKQYTLEHKDDGNGVAKVGETEDDVLGSIEEQTKQQKIIEILGNHKAHYLPLLDQLIFMEDTYIQYQQST